MVEVIVETTIIVECEKCEYFEDKMYEMTIEDEKVDDIIRRDFHIKERDGKWLCPDCGEVVSDG